MNESGLHILEIEITNKCNLNCQHCYVDRIRPQTMPSDKVYELIDYAIQSQVTRLVFTGGEPLLDPNVFNYAKYAREKGVKSLFLLTNGLLIKNEFIKDLSLFDEIQMSLDELPSNRPSVRINYLKQLEEKFELLRKNNIFFLFFVTLNKKNYNDIDKFVAYAREQKAGIAFNFLIPMSDKLKDLVLSPKEVKSSLERIITEQKNNPSVLCNHHFRFLVDKNKRDELLKLPKNRIVGGCLAGIAAAYICVNGDVYPCPFLPVSAGNVFEKSISDIWEHSPLLMSIRRRNLFKGKCGKCSFLNMCGGCRAVSYLKFHSVVDSDPSCIKEI